MERGQELAADAGDCVLVEFGLGDVLGDDASQPTITHETVGKRLRATAAEAVPGNLQRKPALKHGNDTQLQLGVDLGALGKAKDELAVHLEDTEVPPLAERRDLHRRKLGEALEQPLADLLGVQVVIGVPGVALHFPPQRTISLGPVDTGDTNAEAPEED
ncbi:MAG: hypothetical protein O7E54_05720 [Planctomycetota bacterium]|nr:hypothetical protein [Planctomycetota bacterium]